MRNALKFLLNLGFPIIATVISLSLLFNACKRNEAVSQQKTAIAKKSVSEQILWHVIAVKPDGKFLNIKAIDPFGSSFDINAIEKAGQKSFMDVKAFVKGKIIPVKIIVNEGAYAPVKAIDEDGTLYAVNAFADNGERYEINGIKRMSNIIDIKAIDKNGSLYSVKTVSPQGALHDVKGIKTTHKDHEYNLYGAAVYAHVKALPQTGAVGDNFIWNIIAIQPDGCSLPIKAFDKNDKVYDVKAIMEADQRNLLDVKVITDTDDKLAIKLISRNGKYADVKAIGKNGDLYTIKAITPEGVQIALQGVGRASNVIGIKAINEQGEYYGVKAIAPNGELYDVKGIKLFNDSIEGIVNGKHVFAHVKAIPQAK
jgi:hypothetical protein